MSLAGLDSPSLLSPFRVLYIFTSVKFLSRIIFGTSPNRLHPQVVSVCREGIPSRNRIVPQLNDFISAQS